MKKAIAANSWATFEGIICFMKNPKEQIAIGKGPNNSLRISIVVVVKW